MRVLERWHHYADDPEYRALFDDEEVAFTKNIFSAIAGTDVFLKRTATAL